MTQDYKHPITPPPKLVRHWSRFQGDTDPEALWFRIANEAAQWGADQELEACCAYMQHEDFHGFATELRAARRPKSPRLKEQAIAVLEDAELDAAHYNILLRALEALPDD
jgi:hypothetical protein